MLIKYTKSKIHEKECKIEKINDAEKVLDIIYDEATEMNIKMHVNVEKIYNEIKAIKIGTTFIKFYLRNSTITFSSLVRAYDGQHS